MTKKHRLEGTKVPNVVLKTRVRDETMEEPNKFRWEDIKTRNLYANKIALVFALPGAFTPTCSNQQLPNYEKLYKEFVKQGVDEVHCLSVNDAFVMFQWGKAQKVKNVKLLPDGCGTFTDKLGMLVKKDNLGFGLRSWRYAMLVRDGEIIKVFEEPGRRHNHKEDPYGVSSPENVLDWLKSRNE